ncbi:hypothetical protein AMTR_s00074p00065930 [Amborella trichopoda]|uniref:Uncharacterized protein n=1 Tax=Amborella trichopoda TaxID=13333 RepID=W1NMV3_AMBTC|nr:hypothetical protein AMTR_s00074p00065930 [Amborella trichopoda]
MIRGSQRNLEALLFELVEAEATNSSSAPVKKSKAEKKSPSPSGDQTSKDPSPKKSKKKIPPFIAAGLAEDHPDQKKWRKEAPSERPTASGNDMVIGHATNDQGEERTRIPISPPIEKVQTSEGIEDLTKKKKKSKEGTPVPILVVERSSKRCGDWCPQDDSSELLGAQPSKTELPSVRASKAAAPTFGFLLKTMRSRKKMGIFIKVDTPSPPSPTPAALEVEASSEESFASEEHVEATSALDHKERMIDALRDIHASSKRDEGLSSSTPPPVSILTTVEEADPKEDELHKAKGKARMFGDKMTPEILNVPLVGSSSGPFLIQAEVSTDADIGGEVLPSTTANAKSPKVDLNNDVLTTLANTLHCKSLRLQGEGSSYARIRNNHGVDPEKLCQLIKGIIQGAKRVSLAQDVVTGTFPSKIFRMSGLLLRMKKQY